MCNGNLGVIEWLGEQLLSCKKDHEIKQYLVKVDGTIPEKTYINK